MSLGSSVGEPIPQKVSDGHMWDANGKVDMIAGIRVLCYTLYSLAPSRPMRGNQAVLPTPQVLPY
jgi:hypothetical protein